MEYWILMPNLTEELANAVRNQLREQGYTFTPEEGRENVRLRQEKKLWIGTTIPRTVLFRKLSWPMKWHVLKQIWIYLFR